MAELGIRRFEDLIGRSDLLVQRDDIDNWKAKGVDLSRILHRPSAEPCAIRHTLAQDHQLEKNLDHALLPRFACAIEGGETVSITTAVKNTHRSVGTMISHEIVKRHGAAGLPDDSIRIALHGTAGQSFGAFAAKGLTLDLSGDANDYVGKGLSGGRIIVRAPADFHGRPSLKTSSRAMRRSTAPRAARRTSRASSANDSP